MKRTQALTKLIDDILTQGLDIGELRQLNAAVVEQIKYKRDIESSLKRSSLSVGDKVTWTGRHGFTTGVINKVNRKNAKVMTEAGPWSVPLTMLSVSN